MPVRATAKPPGEFIRDHLVAAGSMDYPQSIHRAYKKYVKAQGIRNGASRASMSKCIWLANTLGLIVFDHAEPVSYWDGAIDVAGVAAGYVREPRPQAPSPRHYYRIVDDGDPRWIRLEASYRESIGLEAPPMAPRAPVRPPPPPRERLPRKPPKGRAPRLGKLPRVSKLKPPTPAERLQPFGDRVGLIIASPYELESEPTMERVVDIENALLDLGEEVVAASSRALAVSLAGLGHLFLDPEAALGFSPFRWAGFLVSDLLDNVPDSGERAETAHRIVSEGAPLGFAVECFRSMRSSARRGSEDAASDSDEEEKLGAVLADRIRRIAAQEPLHIQFPRQTQIFLYIWSRYGPKGEAAHHLEEMFAADPRNVIEVLKCYVPTAFGSESGIGHKSDLHREGFDSITQIVGAGVVYGTLRKVYGSAVDAPDYDAAREYPLDDRVAYQFAFIYHKVRSEEAGQADDAQAETGDS